MTGASREIEIKFRVENLRRLTRQLKSAGLRLITPRTHEMNTLYDLPGGVLRNRRELLRIRKFGTHWTLTHKSGGIKARHSNRIERETKVFDGKVMDAILHALGYSPTFRYEKFRAEWVDEKTRNGKGHVVVDETPIGNFCEIEGPPRWIDATARKLGVTPADYITKNYATLFVEWRETNNSPAQEMTFQAVGKS